MERHATKYPSTEVPEGHAKTEAYLEAYRSLFPRTKAEPGTRAAGPPFQPPSVSAAQAEVVAPPPEDWRSHLNPEFRFDNFIVGSGNQFTHAAALAVAKAPASAYNPLFIYGGSGLGKTHLLCAIGDYILRTQPELRVLYITCEEFTNDLLRAIELGQIELFRARYRSVDVLLLDDVQFLAGKERTQEEFFHTFNALYNAHRQIVLTSDRLPRDIPTLEERLRSRFEGGLTTDIQVPDLETRMIILRRRAAQAGIEVPEEVIHYIASKAHSNVRELQGFLNKVTAHAQLTSQEITLPLTIQILRPFVREAPPDPAAAGATASVPDAPDRSDEVLDAAYAKIRPARMFLCETEKLGPVFALFSRLIRDGYRGMVISRTRPNILRKEYGISVDNVFWLTDRASESERVLKPTLETMIFEMEEFMGQKERGVILMDGLEYLLGNNSFNSVIRFIRQIVDEVSTTNIVFLLPVSPLTIPVQDLKMLERETDVLSFFEGEIGPRGEESDREDGS